MALKRREGGAAGHDPSAHLRLACPAVKDAMAIRRSLR